MIELNLLPDVKLEYLRAQRTRRLAMAISFLVTSAAIAILVILLVVEGFQKHSLSNLNSDIASQTSTLQKEPDINSVLSVQSQLESLDTLHSGKPAATRLFDYLNELTPLSDTIGNLTIDFNAHTLSITGSADTLSSVDQYVDTLKFTKYTTGNTNKGNTPAFNDVALSSYSLDNTTTPPVTYTITTNFDPTIFNISDNVTLVIPSQITTRSDLEHPSPLFVKGSSTNSTNGGN